MTFNKTYLSIGSNIGDRIKNIDNSIKLLKTNNSKVIKISSYYDTEPLYYKNQSHFINIVLLLNTHLLLNDLFICIKKIEVKLGRNLKDKRNHERVIDIDILTYNDNIMNNDHLTVPHPRINERKFVLLPWNEISPNFYLFNLQKNIKSLLSCTKDNSKIIKLN